MFQFLPTAMSSFMETTKLSLALSFFFKSSYHIFINTSLYSTHIFSLFEAKQTLAFSVSILIMNNLIERGLAFSFFDPHEVPAHPFHQPIKAPLKGSTIICQLLLSLLYHL